MLGPRNSFHTGEATLKPIISKGLRGIVSIVLRLVAIVGISFAITAAVLAWPLLTRTEPFADFDRVMILGCAVLFSASCIVLLASACLHAMVTLLGISSRSRLWLILASLIGLGIVSSLTFIVKIFQDPTDYVDLRQISLPIVFTVTGFVVLLCGLGACWMLMLVEREKPSEWFSGSD